VCPEDRGFAMPEKVAAAIDKAAKKSLHIMVNA
jgi:hypothetical protein